MQLIRHSKLCVDIAFLTHSLLQHFLILHFLIPPPIFHLAGLSSFPLSLLSFHCCFFFPWRPYSCYCLFLRSGSLACLWGSLKLTFQLKSSTNETRLPRQESCRFRDLLLARRNALGSLSREREKQRHLPCWEHHGYHYPYIHTKPSLRFLLHRFSLFKEILKTKGI